jgi:formylglycine-generating enzyme required for sulfatase activity
LWLGAACLFVVIQPTVTSQVFPAAVPIQPVALKNAVAVYSQPNYPVAAAIDGSTATSQGWGNAGNPNHSNSAIFETDQHIGQPDGVCLTLVLDFTGHPNHGFGRFRLVATTDHFGEASLEDAAAWQGDASSLRFAITDLIATFGERYPRGPEFLARLEALERPSPSGTSGRQALAALAREALLANPLLDSERLLLVKRRPFKNGQAISADTSLGWDMGLPRSSAGNSALPKNAYDNEIAVLQPVRPDGRLTTLFRPARHAFVGDVDLHFDGDRLLFASTDDRGRWQVYELGADGTGLRQVSRGDQPDVDSYDPCYLPDGGILFCGSACFQGVPCNFSDVAVAYRMDADGSHVRQLCFEQDHDFNPAVMDDGRVLYLRWEYSDLPHTNSRRLFTMNPDGTGQTVFYGSNSYWPNGIFGARPIPGQPGKVVGIVAGHHGSHREGELVVFDAGRGRHEADGAVQRIPGRGRKIEPLVRDQLTEASWPKFAHPYPLSDKYFLVTCKLDARAPWDLYLVYGLFEPVPLRPTPRPPVLPPRVDLRRTDAVVHLADVYHGPGLAGVPRGTVRSLRLFTYHFAYQGTGGLLGTVGLDGPWDIKRVLGTVPVESDGSACFRIPANTPISMQPLDEDGKALQLMRSWLVGMPGEVVSCVGCHEHPSSAPLNPDTLAARRTPAEITPWHGPPRNFSFKREVQPVLDRYCVGCHDGGTGPRSAAPNFRGDVLTSDYKSFIPGNGNGFGGRYFSVGYFELSRFVRRPGIESDMHLLRPGEYHADTTELVRRLARGHYQVQLDRESWDRLITWIDLNAPCHGTWTEVGWSPGRQRERRRELRKLYAGVDEDPEALASSPVPSVPPVLPEGAEEPAAATPSCRDWPLSPQQAAAHQAAAGPTVRRRVDLGAGVSLELVLIPAGEFVLGDPAGEPDECPLTRVSIERPFWMGAREVTNRQYARFDPSHDSRFESKNGYQFGVTGFDLSQPDQPVVRVSWLRAMDFCAWLSERTGSRFTLPTEAQWEYACRAGTATPWTCGDLTADYSQYANVADQTLQQFASDPYTIDKPLPQYTKYDDWIPHDVRYRDGGLVTVAVGRYRPNAWGLHDMHGNAAEWTVSAYAPYPYQSDDGRDDGSPQGWKVVRGGSWRDRPQDCRSAARWRYPAWQSVYNVGFRVVAVEAP